MFCFNKVSKFLVGPNPVLKRTRPVFMNFSFFRLKLLCYWKSRFDRPRLGVVTTVFGCNFVLKKDLTSEKHSFNSHKCIAFYAYIISHLIAYWLSFIWLTHIDHWLSRPLIQKVGCGNGIAFESCNQFANKIYNLLANLKFLYIPDLMQLQ